jgi:hypothetical protein
VLNASDDTALFWGRQLGGPIVKDRSCIPQQLGDCHLEY